MKRREGGGGFALCSDDFDFAFSPDFVVKSSRVLPPSSVRRCIKSTVTLCHRISHLMPPHCVYIQHIMTDTPSHSATA